MAVMTPVVPRPRLSMVLVVVLPTLAVLATMILTRLTQTRSINGLALVKMAVPIKVAPKPRLSTVSVEAIKTAA